MPSCSQTLLVRNIVHVRAADAHSGGHCGDSDHHPSRRVYPHLQKTGREQRSAG